MTISSSYSDINMSTSYIFFKLSDDFVQKYKDIKPPFGFNGLGELVYLRTYSRIKENGENEQWFETIERVVNGTYSIQKRWITNNHLGWDEDKARQSAQEMYERMFYMKFLPPGRGLWAMGSDIIEKRGLGAALNNCGACTTEFLNQNSVKPFCFLMDMSMLGVGIGFDTRGAGSIYIDEPSDLTEIFHIPDTREGWVESVRKLLSGYFNKTNRIIFDYSDIRSQGKRIRCFGGISSGPQPLIDLHNSLNTLLEANIGIYITERMIVDIMNLIGKAVVSGNVRRSAEIAFGAPDSEEFLDLKDYIKNPDRSEYGWTSNNSVFAHLGMDYEQCVSRTQNNGEPGYIWLENINQYARINGLINNKDKGNLSNPCAEQPLEGGDGAGELCNLVEIFPYRHDSFDDFKRTLKFAYLYAKTVTLVKTHWYETNKIINRNRRIGCSLSGLAQFIENRGIEKLRQWCTEGYNIIQYYDYIYSSWMGIPKSIRTTTVKPSGTISLLAGATPGIHYPESRYYIRRIRLSNNSKLIPKLRRAGYKIEPAFGNEKTTLVVEIPVSIDERIRLLKDISIWEQAALAAFMQKYWSDNAVSITVTFDPDKEKDQILQVLKFYQYQLKTVSFLPRPKTGIFQQMPYESISEQEYTTIVDNLQPLNFNNISNEQADPERFCSNDACTV